MIADILDIYNDYTVPINLWMAEIERKLMFGKEDYKFTHYDILTICKREGVSIKVKKTKLKIKLII